MSIHQIGNIVTIRDAKGRLIKQYCCDCAEEAQRIAKNLKKRLEIK